MNAYVINSKGVCMTQEMRKDRETTPQYRGSTETVTTQGGVKATTSRTLNTMDEMAYQELETENKKLKKRAEEAEGEMTIVKGIGINSPEMRGLQTELKNLKNSLGDAADKLTVLQLKCDRYEIMRLTVLKQLQEMKDDLYGKEKK
tara:strand:+ start:104 stop:541 length:438 start_codon:yes stop_codon:yes gene_type:complete